jgi:DNA-binding transcriptional LysR family regulator
VAAQVEAGSLQILMPQYQPPEYPVHILHRESRHASAKVRAFIDLLAERLRGDKTLNAKEK